LSSPTNRTSVLSAKKATPIPVQAGLGSLFLPVIQLAQSLGNACAAAVFATFSRRLAVFSKNHPDIGPNNRETGSHMTAHTTTQS
jgi:hypothetical protein